MMSFDYAISNITLQWSHHRSTTKHIIVWSTQYKYLTSFFSNFPTLFFLPPPSLASSLTNLNLIPYLNTLILCPYAILSIFNSCISYLFKMEIFYAVTHLFWRCLEGFEPVFTQHGHSSLHPVKSE